MFEFGFGMVFLMFVFFVYYNSVQVCVGYWIVMDRFEARLMIVSDIDHTMARLREVTLQEETVVYERAISHENKIHEKIQEADLLKRKLLEMEENERNLRYELENAQTALDAS